LNRFKKGNEKRKVSTQEETKIPLKTDENKGTGRFSELGSYK